MKQPLQLIKSVKHGLALKLTLSFFLLVAFVKITNAQWTNLNPTNPVGKSRPTTFVIGDTGYFGNGDPYTNTFNGYVPQKNTWYNEPPSPGAGGDLGFSFIIGDTAYQGDGSNGSAYNTLFSYTPAIGWTNVSGGTPSATPPGGPRLFCVGFSIGHKGYFGTGLVNNSTPQADFYEYDPSTLTWATKSSLPVPRFGGVAFSANGKGYIGLGYEDQINQGPTSVYKDIYQYDPVTDKWTAMASVPTTFGWAEPAYFVVCNKLIITSGQTLHNGTDKATPQTWMFDPSDGPVGKWYQLPDFPGNLTYSPGGFAIRDTGYMNEGQMQDGSGSNSQAFWRYIPNIDPITVTPGVTTCSGVSVTLTADGGGAFKWTPTPGLSDSVTTSTKATGGTTQVTANPSVTTTYTVTEAVCGQTATIVVTVGNGISDTATALPPTVCSGNNTTLSVTGNSTYTWAPSAGLNNGTTGNTVIATPLVTTTYTVTSGAAGCLHTDTVVVTVGNTAEAGVITAVRDTLCAGTPGSLSLSGNSSNIIQWQSSETNGNFTNGVNPTDTAKYKTNPLVQTTWYRVIVGTGSCTDSSLAKELVVPPPLTALFTSTNKGSTVTFNSSGSIGNIRNYFWDFGDGTTSADSNPVHTYSKDTLEDVCLTIYDGSNCSYTFCREVDLRPNGVAWVEANGSLNIYPNPFGKQLTIENKQAGNPVKRIDVYNVLGVLLLSKEAEGLMENLVQLDVSGLAQGMYFLKVKTNQIDCVQMIIKQ